MSLSTLLGLAAGTICTASFVPQAVRIWTTRSSRDISLAMYLWFSVGIALWIVYGVLIASFPIIAANAVTLLLSCSIIAMKLAFDRTRDP